MNNNFYKYSIKVRKNLENYSTYDCADYCNYNGLFHSTEEITVSVAF